MVIKQILREIRNNVALCLPNLSAMVPLSQSMVNAFYGVTENLEDLSNGTIDTENGIKYRYENGKVVEILSMKPRYQYTANGVEEILPVNISMFIRRFTHKHKHILFYFTDLNPVANNFPEMCFIVDTRLSDKDMFELSEQFDSELTDKLSSIPKVYAGLTMTSIIGTDAKWFLNGVRGLYAKDGKFYM